jgi:glycosyltransferase involved in cell wall biosynthesis
MYSHTFVICAYNESKYLEECIRSIISQKSVQLEKSKIILYTSTPNSYIEKLITKYGISFFTKKGGNIGRDWNNALGFVKTKYATIVHQDDVYLPDYGEKVIFNFDKIRDTLLVFTDYSEIDSNSHLRPRNISLKIKTFALKSMNLFPRWKLYQRRVFSFGNFISAPAVSYNLELLKNFQFDETFKMALDWEAWERIMKLPGVICYLKSIEMFHRIHKESETTVNTDNGQREKEELLMFNRYWPFFISTLVMKFYVKNQKFNI